MNRRYSIVWQTISKKGAKVKLIKKYIFKSLQPVFQELSQLTQLPMNVLLSARNIAVFPQPYNLDFYHSLILMDV